MSKSLLTIGIIVSLGSVGCAGVGVQQSSSVAYVQDSATGVDSLWQVDETATRAGVAGSEASSDAYEAKTNLWNPAARSPSAPADERPQGGRYVSDASSGIAF